MRTSRERVTGRMAFTVALGLFGALSVCGSVAFAQRYMFGRADFTTGAAPQSVALGDFNGDGKQDLAVANQTDGTVSILLGKPDATFSAQVDLVAGASPVHVLTGDFNGDGRLDLAVVNNGSNSVSILLGNGDGTFHASADYGAGAAPVWASTGGFNGDGKLDLAVASSADNTVSVLLGNGDGTFRARTDFPVGAQPSSVGASDFNGDGQLDLAVANSNCASAPCGPGSVSILLGDGDGTFQARADAVAGDAPRGFAAADFNGDGTLDLAVANSQSNTVSVLLGAGGGTLEYLKEYPLQAGAAIAVTTGDFN